MLSKDLVYKIDKSLNLKVENENTILIILIMR